MALFLKVDFFFDFSVKPESAAYREVTRELTCSL